MWGKSKSIIIRLALTESGNFFFHPLQFHLEAPNLLVELHLLFLRLPVVAGPIAVEERVPRIQQLTLPLADLRGMHAVRTGQFVDRLEPLSGFHGQLELKLGTVSGAFLGHRFDPPLAGLIIASFHFSQWSSFWGAIIGISPPWLSRRATRVTIENRASRTGVVRAMAWSDHCRWVSTPRCARASSHVTSTDQRLTTHARMCAGVACRSVQQKAASRSVPSGSPTSTERMSTGRKPRLYRNGRVGKAPQLLTLAAVPDHFAVFPGGIRAFSPACQRRWRVPCTGLGPRLPGGWRPGG